MKTFMKVIPVVIPSCYDCVVAQKVGPKGQVVIPKKFRDELGIEHGDEVEVSLDYCQQIFFKIYWHDDGARLTTSAPGAPSTR